MANHTDICGECQGIFDGDEPCDECQYQAAKNRIASLEAEIEAERGRAEKAASIMGCAPDKMVESVQMFCDDSINSVKEMYAMRDERDAALARAETAEALAGRRLTHLNSYSRDELDAALARAERAEVELRGEIVTRKLADTARDAALASLRAAEERNAEFVAALKSEVPTQWGELLGILQMQIVSVDDLAAARADAVKAFAEWITGQEFDVQVKIETQKITMAPDAADRFLAATGTVLATGEGQKEEG